MSLSFVEGADSRTAFTDRVLVPLRKLLDRSIQPEHSEGAGFFHVVQPSKETVQGSVYVADLSKGKVGPAIMPRGNTRPHLFRQASVLGNAVYVHPKNPPLLLVPLLNPLHLSHL